MDVFELIRKQLENDFLSGGLVLGILAAAAAYLRKVPRQLFLLAERNLITTIDISDHDVAFYWLQKYLGEHDYTKNKAKRLTASTRTLPFSSNGYKELAPGTPTSVRRRALTEIVLSPAPGRHLLKFKGHFILLTRTRTEGEGALGDLAYHETMTFQALSRAVIQELIYAAREVAFPPEDNRIAIMRTQYGSNWRIAQRRFPREIDSVVLDGSIAQRLTEDLRWFMSAAPFYAKHGIPYQRGYMLSGPPGNGKTSLVTAMASLFDRDIYIVSLTTVTDAGLIELMTNLPEHSILLLEDLDKAFIERKSADVNERLTLSGFLNAIDGVAAPPGRILFMTTNHLDRIDPAIKRNGRADISFEIGNATPDMAQRLFLRFFPEKPGLADEFAKALRSSPKELSMSTLQEMIIASREDPTKAVELLKAIT